MWVGDCKRLDSQVKRIRFEVRGGLHRNKSMQAVWNAHGEAEFGHEVLVTLDDDVAPLLLKDLLAERQKYWRQTLGAHQTDPLRG